MNLISFNNECGSGKKLTDWGFEKYIDFFKGEYSLTIKIHSLFEKRVHFNNYENHAEKIFYAPRKCVYHSIRFLIIRAEISIQCIAFVAKCIALVATPYFIISVALSQLYAYTCDHDSLCIVLKTVP